MSQTVICQTVICHTKALLEDVNLPTQQSGKTRTCPHNKVANQARVLSEFRLTHTKEESTALGAQRTPTDGKEVGAKGLRAEGIEGAKGAEGLRGLRG